MQVDSAIVPRLNDVLRNHLTAMNQYFLHYRMLKNWDVKGMAEYEYKTSIVEMKRADKLIARILFLEGLPNLQNLGRLAIGENIPEILDCDLKTEKENLQTTRDVITFCESKSDYVSRDLLEEYLDIQEEHIDWLETQQWQISQTGLENYIQSQAEADD